MTDYYRAARRHARRARIWAWIATLAAVIAATNAVLVTLGVYR